MLRFDFPVLPGGGPAVRHGGITVEPGPGPWRGLEFNYLEDAPEEITGLLEEKGRMQALWTSFIEDPIHPDLQVACVRRDDVGPGKAAELLVFNLRARFPDWSAAGTIRFSEGWDGAWTLRDCAPLARILTEHLDYAVRNGEPKVDPDELDEEQRREMDELDPPDSDLPGWGTAVASWLPRQVRSLLFSSLCREMNPCSSDDGYEGCSDSEERQARVFSSALEYWDRLERIRNFGFDFDSFRLQELISMMFRDFPYMFDYQDDDGEGDDEEDGEDEDGEDEGGDEDD